LKRQTKGGTLAASLNTLNIKVIGMLDWINNRYGTTFSENDLSSINDFSLIWNIFENVVCGNDFSIARLQQNLAHRNMDIQPFRVHLEYFKNRYVSNGLLTPRFNHLSFRQKDRRQLVENVLLETNNNSNDIILAIAIIVYRYRNNLFHGIKDIQQIDQQRDNFEIANNFLTTIIDNF